MATRTEQYIDQLARVHRTPRSVEQFGVEVVPDAMRTVKGFDLGAIMFSFMLNPLMFLLSGLGVLYGKLPFWPAFFAPVLGSAITFFLFIALGTFGVDYGVPGQVGARSFFGNWGARIVTSAFRVLTSVYWFAAVTLSGAVAISSLIQSWTGGHVSFLLIALVLAVAQSILAIIGFDILKIFVRIVSPLMVIALGVTIIVLLTASNPADHWAAVVNSPGKTFTWTSFALYTSIIAGSWMSTLTDSADFCRYAKNRRHMWLGYWIGAVAGTALVSFLGVYAATVSNNWNPFAVVAKLHPAPVVLLLMVVSIVLQTVSVNILNHYSGGFSLVNTFQRIGRFWATVIIAVVAVVATGFPTFINNAQAFVTVIGNLASPLAGVMLTDYLLLKRTHFDVLDLFRKGRYWFTGGFNPVAIFCAAVGFVLFPHLPPYTMPSVSALVITGVLYFVLAKAVAAFWPAMREASQPAEAPASEDEVNQMLIGTANQVNPV